MAIITLGTYIRNASVIGLKNTTTGTLELECLRTTIAPSAFKYLPLYVFDQMFRSVNHRESNLYSIQLDGASRPWLDDTGQLANYIQSGKIVVYTAAQPVTSLTGQTYTAAATAAAFTVTNDGSITFT